MKIDNISAPAYHRNGVCGEPFQVCTFTMHENNEPPRRLLNTRPCRLAQNARRFARRCRSEGRAHTEGRPPRIFPRSSATLV